MKTAKRGHYKTKPFSDKAILLPLSIEFNNSAFEALTIGLLPKQMEDKWFVFFEDNWLYFHRSWTGNLIYKVKISKLTNTYIASEFWAERETSIYKHTSNESDIVQVTDFLNYLSKREIKNHVRSGILGLIVGDALGVPVEFLSREEIRQKPVRTLTGFGTHNQPAGTWSDDSSLALCLTDVLADAYNIENIGKSFVDWYYYNKWTPHGQVFDIGIATSEAIKKIKNGVKPEIAGGTDEYSNGNGSLMRILPLLFYIRYKTDEQKFDIIKAVSSVTHGHIRSILSCYYYLAFASVICNGEGKQYAYEVANACLKNIIKQKEIDPSEAKHFERILNGNIGTLPESEIRGSGYVIHALEASLWSVLSSESYKEAVLKAVNLGEDTDTTGAITGGLAGLVFGETSIPAEWIEQLARISEIEQLLQKFRLKYIEESR